MNNYDIVRKYMREHHNFTGSYYVDWYGRRLSRDEALTIFDQEEISGKAQQDRNRKNS